MDNKKPRSVSRRGFFTSVLVFVQTGAGGVSGHAVAAGQLHKQPGVVQVGQAVLDAFGV